MSPNQRDRFDSDRGGGGEGHGGSQQPFFTIGEIEMICSSAGGGATGDAAGGSGGIGA